MENFIGIMLILLSTILWIIGFFFRSWIRYIFMAPIFIFLLIYYLITFLRVLPFMQTISFTVILSMSLFILIIHLFRKNKLFTLGNISLALFFVGLITIFSASIEIDMYITNKAMQKYQSIPEVSINFDYDSDLHGRGSHAYFIEDDITYYWSFKEDDFY